MSVAPVTPNRTTLPEHNLDILRAIAVLLVLADHTLLTTGHAVGTWNTIATWLGQAGVCAFFVHTSLVLMASLERDGAPERSSWIRRFYVRRAWRIYPLAIAVIAIVVLLKVPSANLPATYTPVTSFQVFTNLLLMQDLAGQENVLGVLWTLPMEVQMYIALPFCYLIARKRAFAPIAMLFGAGLAITWFRMWGVDPAHVVPGMWRLRMLSFLPCFLVGVLAYWMLRRRDGRPPLPSWVWPLIIAVDVVIMYSPFMSGKYYWVARIVFCLVIGVCVPLVRDATVSWFTRAAQTIAVYSYGVYLLHPLALRTGFGLLSDQPRFVQWAAFIAMLVGSVFAAYHLIEKPGIALGRRLLEGRQRREPSLEAMAPPP